MRRGPKFFRQHRRTVVVQSHAVDQRLVLRQSEHAWARIPRAGHGGGASNLHESESEFGKDADQPPVLVEPGRGADG